MLAPIKERKIVLYPDLGIKNRKRKTPYQQWYEKCKMLKQKGYNIFISKLLEDIANKDDILKGADIADFVFK